MRGREVGRKFFDPLIRISELYPGRVIKRVASVPRDSSPNVGVAGSGCYYQAPEGIQVSPVRARVSRARRVVATRLRPVRVAGAVGDGGLGCRPQAWHGGARGVVLADHLEGY